MLSSLRPSESAVAADRHRYPPARRRPDFMLCLGGFLCSAVSDHWSRKTIMLIGVIATTFFTLLIPLVQNAEQLIILRLLTGIGAGGAVSAAFPIAAELMPAQHRRTYGAVYEMAARSQRVLRDLLTEHRRKNG